MAPELPRAEQETLRKQIKQTTEDWGYTDAKIYFGPLKGMRVLDVGMGQGPMGVIALASGIKSYTGLDPALCINRRATTRDKRIKRTATAEECEAIRRSHCGQGGECPRYTKCLHILSEKYKLFPFTGLEMMTAFPGKLQLLPGTFESLEHSGFLKRGMFDVATLWMVTEHLPDNRLVIEGIFKWLDPGQFLVLRHHNYYSYDGHHERPQSPKDFDQSSEFQRARANWGHLESSCPPYHLSSLNRVRLGDLFALVDVYFECAWSLTVPPEPRALLKSGSELLRKLTARGFDLAELLINKMTIACARREKPNEAPWLDKLRVYHPPADGSYRPRPLPPAMFMKVVALKEEGPRKTVAGRPRLTSLLGNHR